MYPKILETFLQIKSYIDSYLMSTTAARQLKNSVKGEMLRDEKYVKNENHVKNENPE